MKICLTVNSSPWSSFKGGGQIAVHHWASALRREGHEVHVIYSGFADTAILPPTNYTLHWTRHFNLATLNLNIFSFAWTLRRLHRKERFDVIHGNAEEAFFFRRLVGRRTRLFFTSHAPSLPAGGFLDGLRRPVHLLKNLNPLLLRHSALSADRIITYSQFSRQSVLDGLKSACAIPKVDVVPPGVESSWFDVPEDLPRKPQLIFWGRIEEEKGLEELFHAFHRVRDQHPGLRLILAGEGNRLQAYRALAKRLGCFDAVDFAGWQPVESIQRMAAESLFGIFPSHIESFGLAVAECAAAGLPVIASTAGALPEIIRPGKTGTLVPAKDSEALSRAILEGLANRDHAQTMARQARTFARERYSWESAARKTLELYQSA